MKSLDYQALLQETTIQFSRSSGKGGQNVNKVETKVELSFNIPQSILFEDSTKALLLTKLQTRIDNEGTLRVTASSERTQHANRKKAEEKFIKLIQNALKPQKKRIATAPSGAAKIARLHAKKIQGSKKRLRRKDHSDE